MDFRRTELIFVIAFLLLNVFLFSVYQDKQVIQYEAVDQNASVLQQMKDDGIQIPDNIEKKEQQTLDIYMGAKDYQFTKEDLKNLSEDEQSATIQQKDGKVYSALTNQLSYNNEEGKEELSTFVTSQVLFGSEYRFFEQNKNDSTILYVQMFNGAPILDGSGQILFHHDEEGHIFSYEQSYLVSMESLAEKQLLITGAQALEELYKNDGILPNAKVLRVDLGYTKMLNLQASDVYIPAWFVQIENEGIVQIKRVNAVDGKMISGQVSTTEQVDESLQTNE